MWFDLKNVKITFDDLEAADEFSDIKKIIEEKGYLPEQVFNADENALFWGGGLGWFGKCHKRCLLIRNRSEHQDLRQEEIG